MSVVVLGFLLTNDLSKPTSLLKRVLFPTFVLPNNPIEKFSSSSNCCILQIDLKIQQINQFLNYVNMKYKKYWESQKN